MATDQNIVTVSSHEEKFTKFIELPCDVRFMIWDLCLHGLQRRVHDMRFPYRPHHRHVTIAHVCREARWITSMSVRPFLVPDNLGKEGTMERMTWFARDRDVLHLPVWEPDWPHWVRQFFDTVKTISVTLRMLINGRDYPRQLIKDIAKHTVFPRLEVVLVIIDGDPFEWDVKWATAYGLSSQDVEANMENIAWVDPKPEPEPEPRSYLIEEPDQPSAMVSSSNSSNAFRELGEDYLAVHSTTPATRKLRVYTTSPEPIQRPEPVPQLLDICGAGDTNNQWASSDKWNTHRQKFLEVWENQAKGCVEDEFMKAFRSLYIRTQGGDIASGAGQQLEKDHPWVQEQFRRLPKLRPALYLGGPGGSDKRCKKVMPT